MFTISFFIYLFEKWNIYLLFGMCCKATRAGLDRRYTNFNDYYFIIIIIIIIIIIDLNFLSFSHLSKTHFHN